MNESSVPEVQTPDLDGKTGAVFFLANTLFYLNHWMVFAFLPVLFKTYGFSDGQIGFLIGSFSASSMLLMLPTGILSDYFSPRRIISFGGLCVSLYFLFLLISDDFYWILSSVIIGGAGASAFFVVLSSLYMKIIPRDAIARHVAIYQIGGYLGYALGPLIGGQIANLYSLRTMIGMAWAGSICLFLLTFYLKDYPAFPFNFREYGNDLKKPRTLLLIIGVFVLATHLGAEQTSFSLLMKQDLGFSTHQIGYMFAGIGLWMAALVPFIRGFADRKHGLFTFLFAGMMISGLFQFMTGNVQSFIGLLATRLLHTTGDAMALLGIGVLTTVFFPEARLGGNSGLIYIVRTSAMFSGAIAAGYLNGARGYGFSFSASGIFVLVFAAVLIFSFRRYFTGVPLSHEDTKAQRTKIPA